MTNSADEFLQHYGKKGMRWGVNTSRSGSPSVDVQRHRAAKAKPLSHLDDKTLKELVNRMNMEKQYKRLKPGNAKKGHEVAKSVLAAGVTLNGVMAFANSPAGKALGARLRKVTTLFPTLGG